MVTAGVPDRFPQEAARLAVAAMNAHDDPAGVVRLLPPAARAHLPRLIGELPDAGELWVVVGLARAAAAAGDMELLAIALAAAPTATAAHRVARIAAAVLARSGDRPGARRVAVAGGLAA